MKFQFAALAASAAIALSACAPAVAAPAPAISHPPVVVPSKVPTVAEAERYYVTHLGPSAAWQHATPAERRTARAAYVHEWGSLEANGCEADVRHAYQGTVTGSIWRQPSLPVKATGRDSAVLFGEYTDGICGD